MIFQDLTLFPDPVDPLLLWINLNFWPLVLIAALSLKFAKGMATLRKATSGTGGGLTAQPKAGHTEENTTQSLQANLELQISEVDSMRPSAKPTNDDEVNPRS
jgi:hypothetical protein